MAAAMMRNVTIQYSPGANSFMHDRDDSGRRCVVVRRRRAPV
jgi:hypothetical protein